MSVTAELADGRRLEFPDGTDPAVIQATVKRLVMAPPGNTDVGVNAANKGIAGAFDAVLNTPANVINLGKAAIGTPLAAAGRPDLAPEPTKQPDFAHRAMKAMGFIRDEAEPQTGPQRVLDMSVQGATGALISPSKQKVADAIMGMIGGGTAALTKEAGGSDNAAITASMLTQLVPAAAQRVVAGRPIETNDVKAETLRQSREKGYVVPGSETNTGWLNRRFEDLAGKDALRQEATIHNQRNANTRIAAEQGLPKSGITEGAIDTRIYEVSQPYREVAALSPAAAKNLEILKQVRADANNQYRFYERSADPAALKNAQALTKQADMIEGVIEQIAVRRGRPELPDQLRDARTKVAQLHDVDRALNVGSADVSMPALGRALDKGKPLSGELEAAGRFAEAYPRYAREGASTPPPDVSKANVIASALLGGSAFGASGGNKTAAAIAAAIPFMAQPTRKMLLSKGYQEMLQSSGRNPTEAELRALLVARAIAEREQQ